MNSKQQDCVVSSDLSYILKNVYPKCGFSISSLMKEAESTEYGAYTYRIDALSVKFRIAKITPTKIGQFVTLWERNEEDIHRLMKFSIP